MSEWISVEDRLPEKPNIAGQQKGCLAANEGRYTYICYYTSLGIWVGAKPTHWMPLPEPPKETS